jgi:hypothetical protein
MRTRFISCATLALAASLFLPVALRAQESTAVADEIIRITKAAWAADMEEDVTAAMSILAPEYTELNGEYSTRQEGKDVARRLYEAGYQDSGRLIAAEMFNPKVQVYGTAAILSYNFVGVVQDADGANTTVRAKSTRVYVQQGGTWMLVHANFAPDPLPN